MTVLEDSDIADLIKSTRQDFGDDKLVDIASRLTNYTVMKDLLKRHKREYQSGRKIQGNLLTNHSFSASMVGLHQVIEPNIPNLLEWFELPWRHSNYHWSWERREPLMNRGASQIVNMINARRLAAKISAAELLEEQFWNKPTSSTNKLDVMGVPYWIVKNATAGFNGGNPTGFSTGAGNVDSTTYTRWKNFTGTFSDYTEDGAIRLMKKATRKTNFVSPVTIKDYRKGKGKDHRIFVNEEGIDQFEQEMGARNDNHGSSLTKFMDATSFKKTPFEYVPKLDDDTDNPVYMMDMGNFCLVFLEGDFFHEHDPIRPPNQPNTWVQHTDLTWNALCTNRRTQTVLYKV